MTQDQLKINKMTVTSKNDEERMNLVIKNYDQQIQVP